VVDPLPPSIQEFDLPKDLFPFDLFFSLFLSSFCSLDSLYKKCSQFSHSRANGNPEHMKRKPGLLLEFIPAKTGAGIKKCG
jgi:hypothetical protein